MLGPISTCAKPVAEGKQMSFILFKLFNLHASDVHSNMNMKYRFNFLSEISLALAFSKLKMAVHLPFVNFQLTINKVFHLRANSEQQFLWKLITSTLAVPR